MAQWFLDNEEDDETDINQDIEASPLTEKELSQKEQAWPVQNEQEFSNEVDQAMALQEPLQLDPADQETNLEQVFNKQAAPATDPRNSLLGQYRQLLDQRRNARSNLAMLGAAQQIGQAIAGKTSGKFDVDQTVLKSLKENADLPVQDYSAEVKQQGLDINLRDMEQMRDPSSTISRFYRNLAKKRDVEVDDTMSAWDISQMLKSGIGQTKSGQVIRRTNPETGVIELGIFNPATQTISWTGETAGFAGQVRQDPRTKELIAVNPATSTINKQLTGPQALPTERVATPQETFLNLSPADQKKVDDLSKEFNSETKDQRASYEKIDALTEKKIALATQNEIAASQLGAEVATIFENGRLTDEDVLRYTRRRGIRSRLEDLTSELGRGVITPEKAREIQQTLQVYKQALEQSLNHHAQQKAKTISNRFQRPIDAKQIAPLIYSNPNKSQSSEEKRKTKDGRTAIFDRNTKQFLRYED